MKLYKMRIITTPSISKGGFEPSYKVYCKYTLFYDSIKHQKPSFIKGVPHTDLIPTFKKDEDSLEREQQDQVLIGLV